MFKNDIPAAPASKRERTRETIRSVAIASFREHGYDGTTMRGIAAAAGLSVGNAYHHFPTKDHLVQELYVEVQRSHVAAAEPLLDGVDDLAGRIAVVVRTGLANLDGFHAIAPQFVTAAVSPTSPLNPMSNESAPARELVVGLFRDAVDGATRGHVSGPLARDLPVALWQGYLLLTLFWVYDTSPGRSRTTALVDAVLRVLRFALPMLRLRPFRATVTDIVGLVAGSQR